MCVGAQRRSELAVASGWVKKQIYHLLFKRKCLFLEIILQGLVEVHLWQAMFNIRCCLFEIVLLWWDQSIQMIRTRPPKRPQSDEQTTLAPEGKTHTQSIYLFFIIYPLSRLFFCPYNSFILHTQIKCLCAQQINRNSKLQWFICHGVNSKSGI